MSNFKLPTHILLEHFATKQDNMKFNVMALTQAFYSLYLYKLVFIFFPYNSKDKAPQHQNLIFEIPCLSLVFIVTVVGC